jgi:hypothetical protein
VDRLLDGTEEAPGVRRWAGDLLDILRAQVAFAREQAEELRAEGERARARARVWEGLRGGVTHRPEER